MDLTQFDGSTYNMPPRKDRVAPLEEVYDRDRIVVLEERLQM